MWRAWLVVPIVVAACETEHTLPPPPPEAVASCVTEVGSARGLESGTLWFNEQHQVFRVDGGFAYSDDDYGPAALYFAYDAEGRLEETRTPREEIQYAYSPQEITETSSRGYDWIYTLEAGRLTHIAGPLVQELNQRSEASYTYDATGRITRSSGLVFFDDGSGLQPSRWDRHYTYDEHDRVTVLQSSRHSWTLAYTETPDRLVVDADPTELGTSELPHRATYDFDANHRIIRSAHDGAQEITYRYEDGLIEETLSYAVYRATGDCEAPQLRFAPELPLPFRWSRYTNTVSLPDPTGWFSEL